MACSYGRSPPPGHGSTFRLEKPCELCVDDLTFRPLAGTKPVGADFWQKTGESPGRFVMAQQSSGTNPANNSLVPLSRLTGINDIDAILRTVLDGGRRETHAAIEKLREIYPGRGRREFLYRLRQLRRGSRRGRRHRIVWTEEDIRILRRYYTQGRTGARQAIRELRARDPNKSVESISAKARKLGISIGNGKPRPWTHEEQGYLLWNAGEKSVAKMARKLKRSENAVYLKLSSLGVSGKVRIPKNHSLHRVSKLLGVSDGSVRLWFQAGLFGNQDDHGKRRRRPESGPRLSLREIIAFCKKHPDKINRRCCDADLLLEIEDKKTHLPEWGGWRQHTVHERRCPQCGRAVRGNSYFRHVKRCAVSSAAVSEPEAESMAAVGDYASSRSKV